jgi:hypothetical protein
MLRIRRREARKIAKLARALATLERDRPMPRRAAAKLSLGA